MVKDWEKCLPCGLTFKSKTQYKTHRWKIHAKKGDDLVESDWEVREIKDFVSHEEILSLIEKLHYAKGASRTSVYTHGLFRKGGFELMGVALWMPPTRNACESVNKKRWRRVLALSRLVIDPNVPRGGASFFLKKAVELIRQEGDYVSLVTYADESQNHTGYIYEKSGWTKDIGEPSKTYRWVDRNGKQRSVLSTTSRTDAQMKELGFTKQGPFKKYKFTIHFPVESPIETLMPYSKGNRVEFISTVSTTLDEREFIAWKILDKLGVKNAIDYEVQFSEDSRLRIPSNDAPGKIYVLFDQQDEVYTAVGWTKKKPGKEVFQGFELQPMRTILKNGTL